jgi:hypothetical protein
VMFPRSTIAIREASISFFSRDMTTNPVTPRTDRMMIDPVINQILRDFLVAICSPSKLDIWYFGLHYGSLGKIVPRKINP